MKRFLVAACALAILTGLAGCTPKITDDPAKAILIKPGQTFDGRFDENMDENWFKIEVSQGRCYYIETFNLSPNSGEGRCDTTLTLLRLPSDIIAEDDDGGPEPLASAIYWRATASGTFYLKVTRYKEQPLPGTYSIRMSTTRPAVVATPLVVNDPTAGGRLAGEGQRNWFSFDAVEGESYTVATSNLSQDCDTVLFLRDSDLIILDSDDDGGDDSAYASSLTHTAGYSGVHYVEVMSYHDTAGTYEISVTTDGPPGPGATPSEALSLVPDGPAVLGQIDQADSENWFQFQTTAGTNYYIETRGLAGSSLLDACDTFLTLFDADIYPIVSDDDGGREYLASAIYWQAPDSSSYYLRVTSADGRDSLGRYDITVSTSPPQPHGVRALGVNSPAVSGELSGPGQQDWYSFQGQSGRSYVISTYDLADDCDTMLYLRSKDMLDLAFNDDANESTLASLITYTATYTGTHYLMVIPFRESIGTYRIQVIEQ